MSKVAQVTSVTTHSRRSQSDCVVVETSGNSKLLHLLCLGKTFVWRSRVIAFVLLCASLVLLLYCQSTRLSQINHAFLGLSQRHIELPSEIVPVVNMKAPHSMQTASTTASSLLETRKPGVVYTDDMYVSGFQYPHPELCPSLIEHLRLMILVTSEPSHIAARDTIRLTWGRNAKLSHVGFAFVLGAPPQHLRSSIEAENMLYGDIITGRFVDSYSNLTLKTLSMLEWMDTYCPHATYLLKTDDNISINIERLLDFTAASERINATRTIWGKVWTGAKPVRSTADKYYVLSMQFPEKVYPDYASGHGYLMTSDCIRLLLEAAPRQPYVRMEDVFVTGILASRCNIRRINIFETFDKIIRDAPPSLNGGVTLFHRHEFHRISFHKKCFIEYVVLISLFRILLF